MESRHTAVAEKATPLPVRVRQDCPKGQTQRPGAVCFSCAVCARSAVCLDYALHAIAGRRRVRERERTARTTPSLRTPSKAQLHTHMYTHAHTHDYGQEERMATSTFHLPCVSSAPHTGDEKHKHAEQITCPYASSVNVVTPLFSETAVRKTQRPTVNSPALCRGACAMSTSPGSLGRIQLPPPPRTEVQKPRSPFAPPACATRSSPVCEERNLAGVWTAFAC